MASSGRPSAAVNAPARSSTSRVRSGVMSSMARRSETCVVRWKKYRSPADSTRLKFLTPNSWASSSVCPGHLCPPACIAALFSGGVTMPSTWPSRASRQASTTNR